MKRTARRALALAASLSLLALPGTALAHPEDGDHDDQPGEAGGYTSRVSSQNMHALGHSAHPAQFFGVPAAEREISSDLAFWGKHTIQGNYDGFRIIDVSEPGDPQLVVHQRCNGDQGDVFVWNNIVVRAWNSPAPTLADGTSGRFCDGQPVPPGFEGVHVFDISNPADPALVGAVELPCGSHTLSGAGISAGRAIVYSNNSSSTGCADGTRPNDDPDGDFMDVIAVPLDNPGGASLIHRESLAGPTTDVRTGCHDAGVILGSVNKVACASADTINVFDIGANDTPGGSPEDPVLLFTITEPGVGQAGTNGRWHTSTFTWDGKVIAAGWEPGGGAAPECQSTDPDVDKSMFFYDAKTGAKLGQWTLPRAQDGEGENCTIHNYNVLPLRNGRYVAVGGHYQAGTWVVDFTNPASATTVGFSDPDPIRSANLGGAWSSYGYNGFIYESEIQSGLNVFRLSSKVTSGYIPLKHLNPQTQEFSQ